MYAMDLWLLNHRSGSSDHLGLWVTLFPGIQRCKAFKGNRGTMVQLHFNGVGSTADRLGKDEFLLRSGHDLVVLFRSVGLSLYRSMPFDPLTCG